MVVILACLFILAGSNAFGWDANSTLADFHKFFPSSKATIARPSKVEGIWEIIDGTRIVYYAPAEKILIAGAMITDKGINLTETARNELQSDAIKQVLARYGNSALKIGHGKARIVEFLDPECPYCKKAESFFDDNLTDAITRYVFFYPLPFHPQAKVKSAYILCASDKLQAFKEIMQATRPGFVQLPEDCDPEKVLTPHREAASKMGITGTPAFYIETAPGIFVPVKGLDRTRMEQIIKKSK